MYYYRVRGVYATALAKIITDAGFELVDVSKKLAERLSIAERSEVPPHATVKDSEEDPNTLVIVGYHDAVLALLEELISRVPFTVHIFDELGPYTTVAVKIAGYDRMGRCIGILGDGREVVIQNIRECMEGAVAVVHIVKPRQRFGNGRAVALPGVAVIRDTLVLLDDKEGKVFFSEHIRDYDRRSLLSSLSNQVVRQGFSIRWRSSAKSAAVEKIASDLESAINEAMKLRSESITEPTIVLQGEAIAFLTLSRPAKEYLDSIRGSVAPSAPYHHMLRTCGKHMSACVDFLDRISVKIPRETMEKEIKESIAKSVVGKDVILRHEVPGRGFIEIGPINILQATYTKFGLTLVGRRVIKREGIYDGLGVERKAGDIALTIIPLDEWFIAHMYMDPSGSVKGIYVNINTPPELCPEGEAIRYLDLIMDVAAGETIKFVDLEEFEEARKRGVIPEDLAYMANETAKRVIESLQTLRETLQQFQALALQQARSSQ
ncbi:MAG: DUF402 domain-containing protein [Ignisphaera sp.]|nr:DUF402 domain-containing protein [Ignisphaera sp.]